MSIVIRSRAEATLHCRLDYEDDLAIKEFRSGVPLKTNGIYDFIDGHFVAVFVSQSQIFVRVDEFSVSLQLDGPQVNYMRVGSLCTLSVLGGEGGFAAITYEARRDPMLTEQPFHYVDDSDLDIGLAIYEISLSLQRQRQLLLAWR